MTEHRRALVAATEHQLGVVTRARRMPDSRLSGIVARELVGYEHTGICFGGWLEPPRPELTLMLGLSGRISADGQPLPDAWVGGLSDVPTIVGVGETYGSIDLKLSPLGAYRLLGMPLSELCGGCVSLNDVFGSGGAELAARVRSSTDWDERFDIVETFLLGRLADAPVVDPAVALAWTRLVQTAGRVRIEALAEEIGASRRYLTGRFGTQVGIPPKTAARLMRFADVRRRIETAPMLWSEIAYAAGYADQAHLNREFRQFAGVTPTDFVARMIPGGGLSSAGL